MQLVEAVMQEARDGLEEGARDGGHADDAVVGGYVVLAPGHVEAEGEGGEGEGEGEELDGYVREERQAAWEEADGDGA